MPKNQFIAVVGFSRSGTSLISRILAEVLGVDFGEAIEHIPKNAENPDGFYENQQIMDFNEGVLVRNKASVLNLPAIDFLQHLASGELDALAVQAKNLLTVSANSRPVFGFKDPRLCLTLPIWRLATQNLKTVIIVRSPWAALQSFGAQMQRPLHELEPLWFEYQHRILLNTSGSDRYMLSFERLLSHPLETVTALAKYLAIAPDLAKWDKQLATIVKPGRVANLKPAEPFEYSPHFQPKTKLAYATLNSYLTTGAQPDYAAIGALFQGLRGYEAAHVQPLATTITKLDGELREQINAVVARDSALVEHAKMVHERDNRIAALDRQLQEHSGLLAAHIAMVHERDKKLSHLEQRAQELQELQTNAIPKLAISDARISQLNIQCDSLRIQLAQGQGQLKIALQNEAASAANTAKLEALANSLKVEQTISIEGRQHLEREVIALATTVDELKTESRGFIRSKTELASAHQLALQQQIACAQAKQAHAESLHLAAINDIQIQLATAQNQQAGRQIQLEAQTRLLDAALHIARKKDAQFNSQRHTPVHRLKNLISPTGDLWDLVAPAYAAFKTEPQTSVARQRGLGLFVAEPINANDATVYELTPELRSISEIQFILDDDIRVAGELHLELLSSTHELMAQSVVALNAVGNEGSVRFRFPEISLAGGAGEHLTLRLFTKNAPDPVRLYEMQRRGRFTQEVRVRGAFICASQGV